MVRWVGVKINTLSHSDKQEGLMRVHNINQSLEKLREVIAEELDHNKAIDINFKLVDKLRDIKDRIKENL